MNNLYVECGSASLSKGQKKERFQQMLRWKSKKRSVFVDTGLGVWFVVLCCCRDLGDCPSLVILCGPCRSGSRLPVVDPGERTSRVSLGECGLN